MKKLVIITFVICCFSTIWSQETVSDSIFVADVTEYIETNKTNDTVPIAPVPKKGFFKKLVQYVCGDDNDTVAKLATTKPKFVILGGPHYSTDAKFALMLAGIISHHLNGRKPTDQPSTLDVWVDVSTASFWTVGVSGTTLFPNDKYRLNSELKFNYAPQKFWGIGYDQAIINANESKISKQELTFSGDFNIKVVPHLYFGFASAWSYIKGNKIERPELLEGQNRTVMNLGLGYSLYFDTRDKMTNTTRGCYFTFKQLFHPKFLLNDEIITTTTFSNSGYHPVWRGGILAGELRGTFNVGSPSWAMMAQLGSNSSMRGYYAGRFRDKHSMSAQVELRQHIWKRNGVAVWGGVGNVFHDSHSFGQLLPNFGIGYRFRLRPNVVLRLDYGFGRKGHNGFVMAVNEAF